MIRHWTRALELRRLDREDRRAKRWMLWRYRWLVVRDGVLGFLGYDTEEVRL